MSRWSRKLGGWENGHDFKNKKNPKGYLWNLQLSKE